MVLGAWWGLRKRVRRLDFVVRVGGADGVNYGTPSHFPGRSILTALKEFRS